MGLGPSADEVSYVYDCIARDEVPQVLIDVNAPYGESCEMFVDAGWQAECFESDPDNCRRLMGVLLTAGRVTANQLAVSDKSSERAQFFVSEVSSRISSLAPFHPTHKRNYEVSVTKLAEC